MAENGKGTGQVQPARSYKYIDPARIDATDLEPVAEPPADVLYECLLDVLQLAEEEGMAVEEVDDVLGRILEYRARLKRNRLRILSGCKLRGT